MQNALNKDENTVVQKAPARQLKFAPSSFGEGPVMSWGHGLMPLPLTCSMRPNRRDGTSAVWIGIAVLVIDLSARRATSINLNEPRTYLEPIAQAENKQSRIPSRKPNTHPSHFSVTII